MSATYERKDCRLCLSHNLVKVMELSPTPPGNQFLTTAEAEQEEAFYPLYVMHCGSCSHLQLGLVVDPQVLFQRDYKYVSGTSPVFVKHFEDYAAWVDRTLSLPRGGLVVDIGSNDGTCLRCFKALGHDVLGVDPAVEIAREASANGIPTLGEFFTPHVAGRIVEQHGQAAFVTSHNTCAHVDDLQRVVEGVKHLLAPEGHFVAEVGYAVDVYDNAWFDTIYHEHVDYHTVKPLVSFFERLDMTLVDVQRVNTQGGSIRVVAKRGTHWEPATTVAQCVALEDERGFDDPATFQRFADRISAIGTELRELLCQLKAEGRHVAAYGAPTKSTTLLTHFGIGRELISYIADDNPKKQGLLSPVKHIPVVSPDRLLSEPPDYLVILAWNFADPIIAKNQEFANRGGRFIVPMPTIRVI